jgi:hypothetical protein
METETRIGNQMTNRQDHGTFVQKIYVVDLLKFMGPYANGRRCRLRATTSSETEGLTGSTNPFIQNIRLNTLTHHSWTAPKPFSRPCVTNKINEVRT